MPAKAMVTKSAFPKPHPARSPITWPMVSESPAMLANRTITTRPETSVALIPIRLEITPAKNMVQAVTKRYEVNSSMDSNAEACSASAIVGRIGDTNPIPAKDTAAAKVIAHTLAGCFRTCPVLTLDITDHLLSRITQVLSGPRREFLRFQRSARWWHSPQRKEFPAAAGAPGLLGVYTAQAFLGPGRSYPQVVLVRQPDQSVW